MGFKNVVPPKVRLPGVEPFLKITTTLKVPWELLIMHTLDPEIGGGRFGTSGEGYESASWNRPPLLVTAWSSATKINTHEGSSQLGKSSLGGE